MESAKATADIDFLVSIKTDNLEVLLHKLQESGLFVVIHDKPMTFKKVCLLRATLKDNPDISVDFLFADDDFKKTALGRKASVKIADFSANITTPEDLIILKCLSGREQDRLDAKNVFQSQQKHLDKKYMKKWLKRLGIKLNKYLP